LGYIGLLGDYRVLGTAMAQGAQIEKMRSELAGIRRDLAAVGKSLPLDGPNLLAPGQGARVLADILEDHRNFARLVAFERAGVLTLNDDMSVRTIGRSRLTMEQFVKEAGRQYQVAFSAAVVGATAQFGRV
jgi:hypothetical protein